MSNTVFYYHLPMILKTVQTYSTICIVALILSLSAVFVFIGNFSLKPSKNLTLLLLLKKFNAPIPSYLSLFLKLRLAKPV